MPNCILVAFVAVYTLLAVALEVGKSRGLFQRLTHGQRVTIWLTLCFIIVGITLSAVVLPGWVKCP